MTGDVGGGKGTSEGGGDGGGEPIGGPDDFSADNQPPRPVG